MEVEHFDVSAAAFASYEETLRAGLRIWRDLILRYYELPSMFLHLLDEEDGQVGLRRVLQGDVYDAPAPPILDWMRQQVDDVRADSHHPWRGELDALSPSAASRRAARPPVQ